MSSGTKYGNITSASIPEAWNNFKSGFLFLEQLAAYSRYTPDALCYRQPV